jgi:hypothetical protein
VGMSAARAWITAQLRAMQTEGHGLNVLPILLATGDLKHRSFDDFPIPSHIHTEAIFKTVQNCTLADPSGAAGLGTNCHSAAISRVGRGKSLLGGKETLIPARPDFQRQFHLHCAGGPASRFPHRSERITM